MAGHTVYVEKATNGAGWRRVKFRCLHCDLTGYVRAAPRELADQVVADIMSTHWGATGGDS